MNLTTTNVFERNSYAWLHRKDKGYRRALNEGGTSSSKTWTILQLLHLIASYSKSPLLISVVSESMPHLKRGCFRDFLNILGDDFIPDQLNKSGLVYSYPKTKCQIEFFSADIPSKVRGPRREILYINEANNVPYEAYRNLDVRTRLFTFLDWNPVGEFWAHENGLVDDPENFYIHSTYLDAKHVLDKSIVEKIEEQKDKDPNWWNIYGLGNIGKVKGLVYPFFGQVKGLPLIPILNEKNEITGYKPDGVEFYGLDFGYSNDPTVLVRNIIRKELDPNTKKELHCLYSDQLIFENGLTNDAISHKLIELGVRKHYDEIWADGAEPKSIEEIHKFGFNIKPCPKGSDSVEFGHQRVRQLKQFWTERSLECIKEQRNFRYVEDKNGSITDKTTHSWSHGMDARRYGVVGNAQSIQTVITGLTQVSRFR